MSGHFHARAGERALEMLTQARDVVCTETETALEAALLESDEIKRLAPPFNVALAAEGRAVWFATAELSRLREGPDRAHTVGPLASSASIEASSALRAALALGGPAPLAVRARAVGVEPAWAPGPECFAAGLARFVREHGPVATPRSLLRLGSRLWARRRTEAEIRPEGAEEPTTETPRRPAWDADRVLEALEERSSAPRTPCGGRAGSSASASARSRGRSREGTSVGCWCSEMAWWPRARTSRPARPCRFPPGTRGQPRSDARRSTSPCSTGCGSSRRSCAG